ncbi:MAG: cobalamin-dependent protein [Deltaproteobacteria bacterium]|nr:cobalamin-dependent protein [Deltaproteobacteria bacterium]
MTMTSRERVLTALARREPDRVPWVENNVSNDVARAILKRDDFIHTGYTQLPGRPGVLRVPPEVCRVLPLDSFSIDFSPPRYVVTKAMQTEASQHDVAVEGRIKTREDLKIIDFPDPDDEDLYRTVGEMLERFGGDLCRVMSVRAGVSSTYLSMGISHFMVSLVEEPDLVEELLNRYADWCLRAIRNLQELPFDLVWLPEDLAFGHGPMMSPTQFRDIILPVMRRVTSEIRKPWVFHSDGNLMPILDDLLSLGMDGLANIEPGPMDIEALKRDYGSRICLVGNIDLHYTLTRGTPEETMDEVRRRIAACGPGGGYILASANSLAPYVKPENVKAMGEALLRYGRYPLEEAPAVSPRSAEHVKPAEEQPIDVSFPVLYDAILQGLGALAEGEARRIMSGEGKAEDVVERGLIPAMEEIGRRFEAGLVYLPEMIMAAKAAHRVLGVLHPYFARTGERREISVVLGTVKDDVHDIGKNIVSTVLEGAGFRVVDLGTDVSAERFINAVKDSGAVAVGISSLLSTTLSRMEETVQKIRENFPAQPPLILVGGAPVTDEFARAIGADFRGVSGSDAVAFLRAQLARSRAAGES